MSPRNKFDKSLLVIFARLWYFHTLDPKFEISSPPSEQELKAIHEFRMDTVVRKECKNKNKGIFNYFKCILILEIILE